jgi:MoxR-like ATPase
VTEQDVQAAADDGPPNMQEAVERLSTTCQKLLDEVGLVIVGKEEKMRLVLINILASGNILFEDVPGLAKSLTVNTFSKAAGCDFRRIQFTPDLLPSDITGIYMYNEKTQEFEFRPGPVFTNFLLADEINRAPPKTQAALLETMQERQVTVEGTTHQLTEPYVVMATQNPVEQEGTYPLPEAQMDRFLMKLSMGYPDRSEETEILRRRQERRSDDHDVEAVTTPKQIVTMQNIVEHIRVDRELMAYMTEIVWRTREDDRVEVGSSPRGGEALLKLTRARAALEGRTYVIPDDIKKLVYPSLHHRLILKPEPRIKGITPKQILDDILEGTPVPKV